jgi:acylphosphatase
MTKGRVHLIIHGYVQGVFYRASTRESAARLGLTGWVRNLPDGNVEALFEGHLDNIHEAIEWCREGPPGANVLKIDEEWTDFKGDSKSFDIRYS